MLLFITLELWLLIKSIPLYFLLLSFSSVRGPLKNLRLDNPEKTKIFVPVC